MLCGMSDVLRLEAVDINHQNGCRVERRDSKLKVSKDEKTKSLWMLVDRDQSRSPEEAVDSDCKMKWNNARDKLAWMEINQDPAAPASRSGLRDSRTFTSIRFDEGLARSNSRICTAHSHGDKADVENAPCFPRSYRQGQRPAIDLMLRSHLRWTPSLELPYRNHARETNTSRIARGRTFQSTAAQFSGAGQSELTLENYPCGPRGQLASVHVSVESRSSTVLPRKSLQKKQDLWDAVSAASFSRDPLFQLALLHRST